MAQFRHILQNHFTRMNPREHKMPVQHASLAFCSPHSLTPARGQYPDLHKTLHYPSFRHICNEIGPRTSVNTVCVGSTPRVIAISSQTTTSCVTCQRTLLDRQGSSDIHLCGCPTSPAAPNYSSGRGSAVPEQDYGHEEVRGAAKH